MRLLKLAALALFGYAVYEFFRGMTQESPAQGGAGQQQNSNQEQANPAEAKSRSSLNDGASQGMNITGPGKGAEVATHDVDGGTVRHKVGRGVVS